MSLPNMSALALEKHEPTPTEGWVTLDEARARRMNHDGNVEVITQEEYVPSTLYEAYGQWYFAVRRSVPNEQHVWEYDVYDANGLWTAVSLQGGVLPLDRDRRIWREDYDLLAAKFAPNAPRPPWYPLLKSNQYGMGFYENDDSNTGRLLRVEYPPEKQSDARTVWYEGPKGEERVARVQFKHYTGDLFLAGPPGKERVISKVFLNGDVYTYAGPKGQERITSITHGNPKRPEGGYTNIYEGPKGQERLVRKEFLTGDVEFLEGDDRAAMHVVRKLYVNGRVDHYRGPKEHEYLALRLEPDGTITYYRDGAIMRRAWSEVGEPRADAIVRRVGPDGTVLV